MSVCCCYLPTIRGPGVCDGCSMNPARRDERGGVMPPQINPAPMAPRYPIYPEPAKVGWLCPKCGESNAPFVPTCLNCSRKAAEVTK